MDDYFEIGKIVNTVGVAGEIKVFPTTDDIRRYDLLDTVRIILRGVEFEKTIERVRYHKNLVMIKLEGIDTVEAANALRDGIIVVERSQALPLSENEYYQKDLIGMTVKSAGGDVLGRLADVITTGANDVYIIKREVKKDLLIPAITDCIIDVNVAEKTMTVKLLEGLDQ